MRVKADLHIHTIFSDGSEELGVIVDRLIESGHTHFSITDHDNVNCSERLRNDGVILKKLRENNLCWIEGIEVSCRREYIDLHLLGYGFDRSSGEITALLKKAEDNRKGKIFAKAEYLKNVHGIVIGDAELRELLGKRGTAGSLHFAKILRARGIEGGLGEIIAKYLKACKTPEFEIPAAEMIAAVNAAGGIAVLAHPIEVMKDYGYSYEELDGLAGLLKKSGLGGIEAYHSKHARENVTEFLKIAEKHDLFVTGGSDFHGTNKPGVEIGVLGKFELTEGDCDILEALFKSGGKRGLGLVE